MEGQGVSQKQKRTQRDYSLPFKLQVILEVEKGEVTYKEAQEKYGIQGRSTVLVWLRKLGSLDWQTDNLMKGKLSRQEEIIELDKKIRRLEMHNEILNYAVDVAAENLGTVI